MSGCLTVREVEARMTEHDFVEWAAYFSLRTDEERAAFDAAKQKGR